jgi:hypothetical protein
MNRHLVGNVLFGLQFFGIIAVTLYVAWIVIPLELGLVLTTFIVVSVLGGLIVGCVWFIAPLERWERKEKHEVS